jgi:uncharacterized RDD family membrane protein YckC
LDGLKYAGLALEKGDPMGNLDYQSFGTRLVAQIVDGIIFLILFFVLGAAMFGSFTFNVYGAEALSFISIYLLLFFLYYIVLEGALGATVGKMLAKIKVVREDGSPCGFGPAVVRNILRIVDALPFLYIVGLVLMSRSDKKQRLGDRIAKTVVVKPSSVPPTVVPPTPPQAKRFCTNCGAELYGGSAFCAKCGAKQ